MSWPPEPMLYDLTHDELQEPQDPAPAPARPDQTFWGWVRSLVPELVRTLAFLALLPFAAVVGAFFAWLFAASWAAIWLGFLFTLALIAKLIALFGLT